MEPAGSWKPLVIAHTPSAFPTWLKTRISSRYADLAGDRGCHAPKVTVREEDDGGCWKGQARRGAAIPDDAA